jgi:Right handed beta helix region
MTRSWQTAPLAEAARAGLVAYQRRLYSRAMTTSSLKLFCGIALLALVLPASAFAQASRTWVSGVGDDANPCSRTAPCKTFAGAISKTAAKGEINCLDPAGYGAVTIVKSITIKCAYTEGGILNAGVNGIVIQAAATDTVILEGLDINGFGTGLNGIRVLSAKSVKILKSEIYGMAGHGVDFEASTNGAKVLVADSHIFDNGGDGVLVAPPSGGNATATVRDNLIDGNTCGLVATNHLAGGTTNCGTTTTGTGGPAKINAFGNSLADHSGTAVFTNGQSSSIRIGDNEITGNTVGLGTLDAGAFGGIYSFGDNYLAGNVTDGSPTGVIAKK